MNNNENFRLQFSYLSMTFIKLRYKFRYDNKNKKINSFKYNF